MSVSAIRRRFAKTPRIPCGGVFLASPQAVSQSANEGQADEHDGGEQGNDNVRGEYGNGILREDHSDTLSGILFMNKHHFTVVLERDMEGGFHAFCPALKGCHSEGDTVDEAVSNVREAIEVYLESLAARGEPIPVEDLLIKPVEVAV